MKFTNFYIIIIHFFGRLQHQNKNNTVIRLLFATASSGRFDQIFHYFLIRGHSFLPCDQNFRTAKRLIRKYDIVYTSDEYYKLISKANKISKLLKLKMGVFYNLKIGGLNIIKKTTSSMSLTAKIPNNQKV